MEKLLNLFLEETRMRGITFNESEVLKVKSLSKEKKYSFYKEFYNLYSKFYENLVIPSETSSFYVHKNSEDDLNVIFYDCSGEKIKNLIFKNIKRKELEKILFKQLIGSDNDV